MGLRIPILHATNLSYSCYSEAREHGSQKWDLPVLAAVNGSQTKKTTKINDKSMVLATLAVYFHSLMFNE